MLILTVKDPENYVLYLKQPRAQINSGNIEKQGKRSGKTRSSLPQAVFSEEAIHTISLVQKHHIVR